MRWPFRKADRKKMPSSSNAGEPKPSALTLDDRLDALLKQAQAATGDDERPDRAPAWALRMRSPFQSWDRATSWLGGVPSAPQGFAWPRGRDGERMHFLAQIDLGSVRCGDLIRNKPSGALLVFVGLEDFAAITFTDEEMAAARLILIPEDLPSIRKLGHWADQPTFTKWPVDLVEFSDDGADPPAAFADEFSTPASWITSWALARLDADMLLAEIDNNRRLAVNDRRRQRTTAPTAGAAKKSHRAANAGAMATTQYKLVRSPEFRRFRLLLTAWRDTAAKADPVAAVDAVALEELFAMRRRLADAVPRFNYLKPLMEANAGMVWNKIVSSHRSAFHEQKYGTLPDGLKPFVEARIRGWRGHKLFGLSQLDPFVNTEDRRGQDLLICVHYDELLKTEMEHAHAISVWCDRDRMVKGDYTAGQVIRHSNG